VRKAISVIENARRLGRHSVYTLKDMEYVFCDTDKELTETYKYLNRVEAFLGKKIVRLNAKAGFDHWLDVFGGYPRYLRSQTPGSACVPLKGRR
jgi:hypothetical protein